MMERTAAMDDAARAYAEVARLRAQRDLARAEAAQWEKVALENRDTAQYWREKASELQGEVGYWRPRRDRPRRREPRRVEGERGMSDLAEEIRHLCEELAYVKLRRDEAWRFIAALAVDGPIKVTQRAFTEAPANPAFVRFDDPAEGVVSFRLVHEDEIRE
jgi:hypothetical protein